MLPGDLDSKRFLLISDANNPQIMEQVEGILVDERKILFDTCYESTCGTVTP